MTAHRGDLPPLVGILALQGDVREHTRALEQVGARVRPVRRPADLTSLDGLVVPGGESTVIDTLTRAFGLREPLRAAMRDGLPVFGSCAGMILLADRVEDGSHGQQTLGGLDITVRRNGFGRQVDSFEMPLDIAGLPGGAFPAVFIRAPRVEDHGPEVTVLAHVDHDGRACGVAVRQGRILATAFHPEITGDTRVHRYFVENLIPAGGPS